MDFLEQIVATLGDEIQARLNLDKPINQIGEEYFETLENGATISRFMDSEGKMFQPTNQVELGGFHIFEAERELIGAGTKSKYSGNGSNQYEIDMTMIVWGKQRKDRSWRWELKKAFARCAECECATGRFKNVQTNPRKITLIQKYWPNLISSFHQSQFCIELMEINYQIEATNCKC